MRAAINIMPKVRPVLRAVRLQPVATKPAALRRRIIRQVALLLIIGVSISLLYVWTRIQVIQLGYALSKLRKETADLKEWKSRLSGEVAELRSPGRLEVEAVNRFGMRLPLSNEIVVITNVPPPLMGGDKGEGGNE